MSTLPNSGATELVAAQAGAETAVNEMGRHLDAGFAKSIIEDRDLTAPPGSCADGARYLVDATATGAWAGEDGSLAIAVGTNASNGWLFVTVEVEGFELYVRDENLLIRYDGAAWQTVSSAAPLRPIAFFFTTTPTSSEVLLLYTAAESITLADDFAGSVGDVGTNPTASFVLDVQKNGASVGSITISTGGAFTFATTGTTVSLAAGDQLKVVAPASADATVANVSITLKGSL